MRRKVTLQREAHYRIVETMGEDQRFVGKRVKLLLIEAEETLTTDLEGFLYDLEAIVLSKGKMQEQRFDLPPCKVQRLVARKCSCAAYRFPHAPGLGACTAEVMEPEVAPGVKLENLSTTERSSINLEELFIKRDGKGNLK
jgi:hypothetical protein